MMEDAELLRHYLESRSESAFTELVQRHIGLVYSGALRRLGGDAHLAKDVTQQVFSDFARKARSLTGRVTLSGWFYVSMHRASAECVRTEQRRKRRETEALAMETMLAPANPQDDADRLRPLLEEVICELDRDDREAVVLRFFEQRSFAEIGSALRLNEDTARKRVERALDKLRARLAKRGVTSTTLALTAGLAQPTAGAVSTLLTAQVAGTALTQVAAAGGGTALFVAAASALKSNAALVFATAVLAATALTWQHRTNESLKLEITRLHRENQVLVELERDNARLGQLAAEANQLRRGQDGLPALRLRAAEKIALPPVSTVSITVTPDGTIRWDAERVNLAEFIRRLQNFQAQYPGIESQVIVQGKGAGSPALHYVVGEARKAQIKRISIEGESKVGGAGWFPPSSP